MKIIETPEPRSRFIKAKKWRFSSGGDDLPFVYSGSLVVNGPGDLHHLAPGGAKRGYNRRRINREVEGLQELLGRDINTPQPVEELLLAKIDVLRHRHRGHQAGLLEHHGDAVAQGVKRCGIADDAAQMLHLAGTRLDDSRDDFGEGRFSGAILTQQRVNLAFDQGEIDILHRRNAAIGLGDVPHLDNVLCHAAAPLE